jgi:hypothetical protein
MGVEHFERDGIFYVIGVEEFGGWFRANWTCPACNASGSAICATRGEAIRRAKLAVSVDHHAKHHATPDLC